MSMYSELIDLAKIIVPAILVLLTTFLLLRSFLNNKYKKDLLDMKRENAKQVLPVRLQAYERLTLFVERINPQALVTRVNKKAMKPVQLRDALVLTIKSEFEHNISQQIYVSQQTWSVVLAVKDELINTINKSYSELTREGDTLDYIKGIMDYYMAHDRRPMQSALDKIAAEAQKLF